MKLATCAQMRAVDKASIEEYGVPGLILMENAARSVFEACRGLGAYPRGKAAVLCGAGNNGGDGFALARHMRNGGAEVLVITVGDTGKISGDARVNYEICKKMGMDIREWAGADMFGGYPLIIDAMLGTGVSGELIEPIKSAVEAVNGSGAYVVAVDCPTGGDPDTGRVAGGCVKADMTVTLAMAKPGLLLYPLAGYAGRLEVGGISAPREALDRADTGLYALDGLSAAALLPKRESFSHKGTFGRAAIAAGSAGMTGAAAFCAEAAYKAGCGYVNVCAPASAAAGIGQLVPQAVVTPLPEQGGFVCAGALPPALGQIAKATVCLIGPGLGQADGAGEFVRGVISRAETPLILDADALNALAADPGALRAAARPPVITPHPLEMSRLTGLTVARILDDMIGAARGFAEKYNTVVALKAASTVVASPGGDVYINKGGCSAMAKAGSGDVLAGLIAGLMAQGFARGGGSGEDAARYAALGVYIHSRAGKTAAARYGEYSVGSAETLGCVHEVFQNVTSMAGRRKETEQGLKKPECVSKTNS